MLLKYIGLASVGYIVAACVGLTIHKNASATTTSVKTSTISESSSPGVGNDGFIRTWIADYNGPVLMVCSVHAYNNLVVKNEAPPKNNCNISTFLTTEGGRGLIVTMQDALDAKFGKNVVRFTGVSPDGNNGYVTIYYRIVTK